MSTGERMITGLAAKMQELKSNLAQSDRGTASGFEDPEEIAYRRTKAESELDALDDAEDMYQTEKARRNIARYHVIRQGVVEYFADVENCDDDLFELMCELRVERNRVRAVTLRAITAQDMESFPPEKQWLKTILSTPARRASFLSHLELGCPYWELQARTKRLYNQHMSTETAKASDGVAGAGGRRLFKAGR